MSADGDLQVITEYAQAQARLEAAKANRDGDPAEYQAAMKHMAELRSFWRGIREVAGAAGAAGDGSANPEAIQTEAAGNE